MALQASGAISLDDIRTEFIGGSGAVSLLDLYKGAAGGNAPVRDKAANNTATDLSAGIPSAGAIAFDDFYGTERTFQLTISANTSDKNASTIFGDDYTGNYNKRVVVNSSITVSNTLGTDSILYPSGAGGTLQITNNGTISAVGGYAINNASSVTVGVTNNGTVSGTGADAFNSSFSGNTSAQVNWVGGWGGASGPDMYHSDYGSGFNCKVTRSGNTFTASWTYNELDYANIGAGSTNISSIFPLDGSGNLDYNDTSEYLINTNAGSNGRDTRDLAFGSKIVSGVREIWFGSNNKDSTMTLGGTMSYSNSTGSVALNTSTSRRSVFFQYSTGGNTNGSVTGV